MEPLDLPESFKESCINFKYYPQNIVLKKRYGETQLRILRQRFDQRIDELLVWEADQEIEVKEVHSDGKVREKQVLRTNLSIREWLGDTSRQDPNDPEQLLGGVATKADPWCRFVFLLVNTPSTRLKITKRSLYRLLTYHQVTPDCIDFFDVYGDLDASNRELRYTGFRTEICIAHPPLLGTDIPELNRSGRRYQICYNLKAVSKVRVESTEDNPRPTKEWKILQGVFIHHFDVETATQLWIFGDPHTTLRERIGSTMSEREDHKGKFKTATKCFTTTLTTHTQSAKWCAEGWHQHIIDLEKSIEDWAKDQEMIAHLRKSRLSMKGFKKVLEDRNKTYQALMAMRSNYKNLERLTSFYTDLVKNEDFPDGRNCQKSVETFAREVDELIYNMKEECTRLELLTKTAEDRKNNYVKLFQAQAVERVEEALVIAHVGEGQQAYEDDEDEEDEDEDDDDDEDDDSE
ncbi:hypothetical protein BX600DRAFT_513800 [Xylariales sp. PMI_506]|nr:hypothetical protein BX600DRAFT_513800 [Xylariales sp. PMI_506]